MNEEELNSIQELIDRKILLAEVTDGLTSSDKKVIALWNYTIELQQENHQLKQQLEYLRSGEYLNQLKFERNMLEDIVQNMEVSKEDKEFIDMTHRNTELLEENHQLKEKIDLRNKEKGDICNKLVNYREKNKRLKKEITNLISINKCSKFEIRQLKDRIEKAIEYTNERYDLNWYKGSCYKDDLLKTLKGE